MDRYNDIKILLKTWEQSFVQEHQRKPNKGDIDGAPEETKKLYKEYRKLKQAKENSSNGHTDPTPTAQTPSSEKESDCWGTQLNRKSMPVAAPKLTLTAKDRESLQASAQYFGMKLKSNLDLGALTKERPVSLKKSFTPRRTPLKSFKDGQSPDSHTLLSPLPKPANTRQDPLASPMQRGTEHPQQPAEEPFEPLTAFTPSKLWSPAAGASSSDRQAGSRAQQLRQTFTKRLTSVDSSWLERCQVFDEVVDAEKPVVGNLPLAMEAAVSSPYAKGGGTGKGENAGRAASSFVTPSRQNEGTTLLGERASKSTITQARPSPDEHQPHICCGVTSAADPASLWPAGQRSSLGSGSGGGEGEDGETRSGLKGQTEGGTTEETAIGATTAKKSQARARKGRGGRVVEEARVSTQPPQAEGDELGLEKKGTKKKGGKSKRDPDTDGENPEGTEKVEGAVKKRRRTKKEDIADGGSPKKAPRARKKAAKTDDGDVSDKEDGDVTEKEVVKQKPRVPQENLLGEVDEEDINAARNRGRNTMRPKATKNSDGNFVKINLKKKSHVKGYACRGAGLRKQLTMEKFQLKGERFGGPDSRFRGGFSRRGRGGFRGGFGGFNRPGDSCFKCGGTGHWAMNCKGRVAAAVDSAAADEASAVEEEPFELPTLEDVARATGTLRSERLVAPPSVKEENESQGEKQQEDGDEVLLNVIRPDYERPPPPPPMQPLYPLGEDGKVQAARSEVYEALKDFGYRSFRPGQEQAIMRILSGMSTLVVLSTGMGKSLCYQLPAYLYAQRSNSITLVVSPLVSLMDDQLSGLPSKLKAAAIHSNMSKKQREAAVEKVKAGEVHVLLLSPEALVGGGHSGSGCLPPADQLPPVAFACIDEAHCVSEWSHNFRPCYLRLCKVLRDRLGVRCLLGLTATATLSTALDIAQHLDITDQDGIAVRSAAVPHNLQLSVSMDRDKDQALVSLLKGERFGSLESVIVYCTRRDETTRISALLRTCLQGVLLKESNRTASQEEDDNPVEKKKKALARKKIRKPLKWMAESYHAGMSSSERRRVQNNFMCGELRVVVATVAFGMGLDKSDVRGIVHYNMPKSFESYVQEIGRAGRDWLPAHCHLFLDPEGGDLHELRRHIYADTVDHYTVKKLVQKVFPPCKCRQIHQKQQDLARAQEEVDDSEMMELMDTCDETSAAAPEHTKETSQNTPVEQLEQAKVHTEDKDVPTLQPSEGEQKEPPESSVPLPQRGDGEQDVEEEVVPGGGDDWPTTRVCHTHERTIPIQDTVEALDITEEGLETLLCYLELHPQQWVELLHPTLSVCKMVCYNGPQQLRKLTKSCPPVAVVLARKRMAGERVEACDSLDFDVVEVADTMGWQLGLVKRGLRQLQWATNRGVLVEFSNLSFYFRSYGDLTPDEMDRVCEFLHDRVVAQERTKLYQLKACFKAFRSVAYTSCRSCTDQLDERRSLKLKGLLGDYFDKRRDLDLSRKFQEEKDGEDEVLMKCKMKDWEGQIRTDIQSFLGNHSDEKFSGRAVARIFHGIGSPCYPAQTFGRDRRYWRKYIQFDFNEIIRFAIQEIVRFK
ncbi:ATP-dependent DNA helicase Q4 [Coregonus clupeaformis]|uniref:ATP-dependent DNA helicase Q4 n=1 Tax=Coregonus clupeaformis TaxID=59861 RepID=UPI001E1C6D7B|nr:ATP-dependent DNA helicase Q4 [Coregonus clupeaformis]XP_041739474.2 ATP-dependent DNA helicase Q4 [Coregonus clupeaformis]